MKFDIDELRCIYCGMCEEACPVDAIELTSQMDLVGRTRDEMILDKEEPLTGRYLVCLPNGCMADFDVTKDFVGKLKKGQQIVLQGINLPGQAASYMLPLADFAKANEGPATDPKQFEADQKKLQDELQKKAEDARKRLQASPPAGTTPGSTPMMAPTTPAPAQKK